MTKIVIHTEQHPEDNAMLQALYSRSDSSVTDHIEKLKEVGSGKFMSQYYLGYGHASIADCGFITIYIEDVSMLAAKAIQDNPLYNGQESSSRYIDWSVRDLYNPYEYSNSKLGDLSKDLSKSYTEFYTSQKPVIVEHLTNLYPKGENEKQSIYEKAINAKAFDILRGFLPCGATTNVSWTTSLRKANEQLQYLFTHPLEEVRNLAIAINFELHKQYPNSITELPKMETISEYVKDPVHYYSSGFELDNPQYSISKDFQQMDIVPDTKLSLWLGDFYKNRPRKANLPKHDPSLQSTVNFYFNLDFGSYRDLQRHRAGYCTVPAIDNALGFHAWYFDQLPDESKSEAKNLFQKIEVLVEESLKNTFTEGGDEWMEFLTETKFTNQYLLPMGTLVQIQLKYNIHQALYVAELRSSQTVHATLRPVAQQMGKFLQEKVGIPTYCDYSDDAWNTRRGAQDITPVLV